MVRETSKEAYEYIKRTGVLAQRSAEVYQWLYHNGPATAQQMYRSLSPGDNPSKYLPRLAELRKKEVVQELGKTKCEYTGRNVILWDVTDKMPKTHKEPEICKLLRKEARLKTDLIKVQKRIDQIRSREKRNFDKSQTSFF